jgi:N-acetylglucosamine kinase-like BadF-type ATPase
MILIADSGSTKTEWQLINKQKENTQFLTKGINPFFQTEKDIVHEIETTLLPSMGKQKVDAIYFYGAGCSFPDKKLIVLNALGSIFRDAIIEVESDLTGAARALFGKTEGIACIMGTGSNSCHYDGKTITHNVSPLGYILGDEGSGAVLGKTLVADCLKKQLPAELVQLFFDTYNTTPAEILENVYKKPFPNRYLASFSPFLNNNIHHEAIYNIVYKSFDAFFTRNIQQYDNYKKMNIALVGSVAHYFENILQEVAKKHGCTISSIVKNPMEGMVKFHEI